MEHVTKPYTAGTKQVGLLLVALIAFCVASLMAVLPFSLQPKYLIDHHLLLLQYQHIIANYFVGYVLALTLCGLFVDLVGATTAIVLALLLALLGNLLFTYGTAYAYLLQARFMVGFQYGLISIALLKQLDDTFHRKHFPFGVAIIVSLSVLMTALSETFLFYLGANIHWKLFLNSFTIIVAVVFLLSLFSLWWGGLSIPSKRISLDEILYLIKRPAYWFGAISIYLIWQYVYFILNRLTLPYLQQTFHYSNAQIHTLLYIVLAVFIVSALILGYFAEIIGKKRFYCGIGYLLIVGVLYALISQSVENFWFMLLLLSVGSLGASVVVLLYARLREYCTASSVGFTFGLLFLVYMLCQILLAPYLMRILTKVKAAAAVSVLSSAEQYSNILSIMVILMLVGAFLAVGLRAPLVKYQRGMTLGQEIKNAWQGAALLSRTFWLLNVVGGFYVALLLLSLGMLLFPYLSTHWAATSWLYLLFIPYLIFALLCTWRCAHNVSGWQGWKYLAKVVVIVGFVGILWFVISAVYSLW